MAKYMLVNGIRVAKSFNVEKIRRLTVAGPVFLLSMPNGERKAMQVFICDCGNTCVTKRSYVTHGKTYSCGCELAKNRSAFVRNQTKHMETGVTAEHKCWLDIKARCADYSNPTYGGKGVSVCERWTGRDGYANFLSDLGRKPSAYHSIERIDSNGDYSPDNCRWATDTEQARNRSNNRLLTFNGKTQCIAAWSEETGIKASTINKRIYTRGWSVEDALTKPLIRSNQYGR
jgi:hypothetical protein